MYIQVENPGQMKMTFHFFSNFVSGEVRIQKLKDFASCSETTYTIFTFSNCAELWLIITF